MRKVTQESVSAFVEVRPFKSGNTRVEVRDGESFLYLHDNMIAHRSNDTLFITTCGWSTNTTKERLNGVLRGMQIEDRISQKDFQWYIGGEIFNSRKTFKL